MKKENTHIVIKKEDALKYLTEVEYQTLEEFMNTIIRGRAKDNSKSNWGKGRWKTRFVHSGKNSSADAFGC